MPAATHGQGEGVCIEGGKAVDCMHDWGPVVSCGVDLNPFALVQSAVRSSFDSEAAVRPTLVRVCNIDPLKKKSREPERRDE